MEELFEWDAANLAHVRRHGVEPTECEQAIQDPRGIPFPVSQDQDEERLGIIGETEARRLLAVVITPRAEGFRIVTAYPANRRQQRAYREVNP